MMDRAAKVVRSRRSGSTIPVLTLKGAWLAESGFPEGSQVMVYAYPGRLILTPRNLASEAQKTLGDTAEELRQIQRRLEDVAQRLPNLPSHPETEPTPLVDELLGAIECVLMDDVKPAIRTLVGAASITEAELRAEWEQRPPR